MIPDEIFMQQALKLAKQGLSWTNPNPMVGALIVKNGIVIGKGFHRRIGLSHAEIEALNNLREKADNATLYVNLEPCSHFGKTPPCTQAIIKSGIKKVVCSTLDPDPRVSGKGVKELRQNGIEVILGVLEEKSKHLNETFFTYQIKKRPFVALKFAQSLDGKIATKTGDSKWITNQKARNFARKLRSEYQAILVGINTVLKDNPHLGSRIKGKKDPVRIILDNTLKIPLTAQVLRDSNVIIVTTAKAGREKIQRLKDKGFQVMVIRSEKITLDELMEKLYDQEIISILVEGGSEVLGSFIDKKLADKVYAFFAPIIIGGKDAKTPIAGQGVVQIQKALQLRRVSTKRFDDNFLFINNVVV